VRRVARQKSFTTASAGCLAGNFELRDWLSSSFLRHYDETESLVKSQLQFWALSADGDHMPSSGHCMDVQRIAAALQVQQLGFTLQCAAECQ
jgi:hypothetical protein